MRLASAFVAVTMGLSGIAFAADDSAAPSNGGGGHSGFREACGTDLQTYCATSKTRDERRACVKENKDKFSEGCKSFMATHQRPESSAPAGQ